MSRPVRIRLRKPRNLVCSDRVCWYDDGAPYYKMGEDGPVVSSDKNRPRPFAYGQVAVEFACADKAFRRAKIDAQNAIARRIRACGLTYARNGRCYKVDLRGIWRVDMEVVWDDAFERLYNKEHADETQAN